MRPRLLLLTTVVSAIAVSAAVAATPAAADATPTWTTATFPVPTAPNGDIEAVDCAPGGTYCVEVGSYFDATGRPRPLIAHEQSVADWVQDTVPALPPAVAGVTLKAVSCTGPTMCVAVGSISDDNFHDGPLVLTWNGTAWSRAASPLPGGTSGGRLAGVSCATPTACVAVGDLDVGASGRASLSYSYDGAQWTARPVPVVNSKPFPFEGLYAVSCPAARSCTAVGYGRNAGGLIQVWNGSTWHSQRPAAAPGAFIGELDGVSCVSTTTCSAVGYLYSGGDDDLAQAQRLVSGKWVRDDVPTQISGFTTVDCPTATACTAVATEGGTDDIVTGVGDRSDTGKWAFTPLDLNDDGAGRLTGVTCRAVATCTAVADTRGRPVGFQQTDGTWSGFGNVAPAGVEGSRLGGVSCTTATACTTVGRYTTAAASLPLIERFDGAHWRRQPTPDRARAAFTDLADVSCPTTTACVAVGSSGTDPGGVAVPEPLLMRWSSSGWATVPSPSPSGTQGALVAVSCPSATSCVAVGYTYGSGTGAITYVLSGSTWTEQPVTLPTGITGVNLTGVSCAVPTVCHAVGTGYGESGTRPVDLVWNGTSWSSGPTVGAVDAVSCVGTGTVCTAVGTNTTRTPRVVVNVLRGGAWSAVTTPAGKGEYLSGVSCVSTTCTAVGTGDDALVMRSAAGQAWKLESAVTPPGPGGLQDVSCADITHCVAVGTFGPTAVIEVRAS